MGATQEHEPKIVRTLEELDAEWLQAALHSGPIGTFAATPIGTGQMSQSHRISLDYTDPERAGPATVVLKLASVDASSRGTGVGLGIYEREVRFYSELAPRIGGPLASCRVASYDEAEGWFTLLLEDVAPALPGDQLAGCSVEQARIAMHALARLHAPVLEDPELAASGWLNRPSPVGPALVSQLLPGFLERYGERIAPEHRALCERFVPRVQGWLDARHPPQGLVHGDFRLDNLLFGGPGSARPLTVVDWQTVGWGGAMADAAYFLGGGLEPELRRTSERELFAEYHDALCAQGMHDFALEDCWREYRRHAFAGVLMAIVASMLVERTDRGDEMFIAMLARHGQQALDLDSEALLEATDAPRPAPLQPRGDDEGAHEPGPEQLWNESWYFDAVAPDGSLGAYVRVGLYPNLGVCWYTAFVCGPGRSTIAAVDFAAPLPAPGSLDVSTPELRAEHRCAEPLARFSVSLQASAQAYEDASGLLRGAPGAAVALALDLTWETAGLPYAYRMATRYEIPCEVTGKIRIGDEQLELSRALGQRDHSWGLRDWWAMDWMWSAIHLDDGARLHAVELRLPNMPALGVGYVQSAADGLIELERVSASERVGADGLITDAELRLDPPGLELEVEPLAFGPLRLLSPDGRVSHFPRAMCRARTRDGREGVGWIEWNLNQPG
jgi:thiamine kinase-like enzyme